MKKTRTKKTPPPAEQPLHEIVVENNVDVGRDTGEGHYRPGSSGLPGCTMGGSEPWIEYRLKCGLEFGDLVALTARYHGIKSDREISDLRMVMALWGYFDSGQRRAFRNLMWRFYKDSNTEIDAIALLGPGKRTRENNTSLYMLPTDPEVKAALELYLQRAPRKMPPMKQQLADIAARAAARAERQKATA